MIRRWLANYAIFAALLVECLFLALATDAFFTHSNLGNVLRQNAFTAILAAGMSLVILTGGIDLSVGSVVGLAGVLSADALLRTGSLPAGVAVGLLVGLAVGTVNGLAVTKLRVPPFIVSLAMMLLVRGAAYKYTNARTISGLPSSFAALSQGALSAAIMAAVFALTWLLLMRTPFGRHVYATGGNPEAAWLAGIRVDRVLLAVYALCGLCAGIAGLIISSNGKSADGNNAGLLLELDAILAVVLGGTSLAGGKFSLLGSILGAFLVQALTTTIYSVGVAPEYAMVVKGVVVLVVSILQSERTKALIRAVLTGRRKPAR